MRIFVTGTRGIPDIPGGVEKHCQELYPLIAAQGHEVIVATRKSYVTGGFRRSWRGVRLVHIYAPHKKSLEAIVHTFLCVMKARLLRPDVVHIHAVGPGLIVPFARMLGLRVVVTNHGPDYDRQKWGKTAKAMLRLGEYLGGKFANEVIVISEVIADIVRIRCGRESNLIYNGVPLPENSTAKDYIEHIGAYPGKYVLAVSRFVPEKGLDPLVRAFEGVDGEYQLVIAGDADHETDYSRNLKQMIGKNPRIIHTGYITGEPLRQVFSHARLFVLPSFHEGLPIALLEAMSYGLPVLVSDIPANLEVGLPADRYFKCGDEGDLRDKMTSLLKKGLTDAERRDMRLLIAEKYNWPKIAEQTVQVYRKALGKRPDVRGPMSEVRCQRVEDGGLPIPAQGRFRGFAQKAAKAMKGF
jgi:glycosyltransferase involved in cell wall biosynthesis